MNSAPGRIRVIPAKTSKRYSCTCPMISKQGRTKNKGQEIMKKILFAFFVSILLIGGVSAQRIENGSRSTIGYISASGTVENGSRSTIGYINDNGSIENGSRSTIGYIDSSGKVEDGSRNTIGYISDNGTVENGSRSTIGYVNSNGTSKTAREARSDTPSGSTRATPHCFSSFSLINRLGSLPRMHE